MAASPRSADLRLTIPATPPYRELAGRLAAKFAEYSGASADAAGRVADQVQALAKKLATGPDITFTLEAVDRQLRVTADAGGRREQAVLSF